MTVARAIAERVSWGLADQAVSSMTNFAVGVFVARTLGAAEFGIFSLVWITYGVVLNISRGLASDPMLVRFSREPDAVWHSATARMTGTAVVVGVTAGAVAAIAGGIIGGALGGAFVALGIVTPALTLQDSWRFAFFAAGRGRRAFVNDLVWGIALIPAMAVAALGQSVFGFVVAWGLCAAAAALFGCVQTRSLPRVFEMRLWMRDQRDLGPRYLAENVCNSGAFQIRLYGVGAIAGLADVGAIRGAELLNGPFLAVLMGVSLVAVPEAARVLRRSRRRLPLFCLLLGGSQAVAAVLWGTGLLFLLPDAVGRFLLSELWPAASALIIPVTLSIMNACLTGGASAGLHALGAARRSLNSQLAASAAYVTGGLVGAVWAGAAGASWGCAVATMFGAAVTWTQLHRALRKPVSAEKATEHPSPELIEEPWPLSRD